MQNFHSHQQEEAHEDRTQALTVMAPLKTSSSGLCQTALQKLIKPTNQSLDFKSLTAILTMLPQCSASFYCDLENPVVQKNQKFWVVHSKLFFWGGENYG